MEKLKRKPLSSPVSVKADTITVKLNGIMVNLALDACANPFLARNSDAEAG